RACRRRGSDIVVADPAGDVPKPLNEGFFGNGNGRVGLGEHVVHVDDAAVLDVREHLLAEWLAGRILERPYIFTLCRRGAGKHNAGPAVETKHIEVAVSKAAVWSIELGERAGLVGLDRCGGPREQRLGFVGGSGLLCAGSTTE